MTIWNDQNCENRELDRSWLDFFALSYSSFSYTWCRIRSRMHSKSRHLSLQMSRSQGRSSGIRPENCQLDWEARTNWKTFCFHLRKNLWIQTICFSEKIAFCLTLWYKLIAKEKGLAPQINKEHLKRKKARIKILIKILKMTILWQESALIRLIRNRMIQVQLMDSSMKSLPLFGTMCNILISRDVEQKKMLS